MVGKFWFVYITAGSMICWIRYWQGHWNYQALAPWENLFEQSSSKSMKVSQNCTRFQTLSSASFIWLRTVNAKKGKHKFSFLNFVNCFASHCFYKDLSGFNACRWGPLVKNNKGFLIFWYSPQVIVNSHRHEYEAKEINLRMKMS